MTEPKTFTLDAPGAVLHYDVRDPSQASTERLPRGPNLRRPR